MEDAFSSNESDQGLEYDENASLSDLWVQFLMHETDV